MLTGNNKLHLSNDRTFNSSAINLSKKVLTKFTSAQTVVNRGSSVCVDPRIIVTSIFTYPGWCLSILGFLL